MKIETYITNSNIEELKNEIDISNILLNINQYKLYFQPILQHNISSVFNKKNTLVKYKNIKPLIINNKINFLIEKELRYLLPVLPISHKTNILEYLNETINQLLSNNIFTPLNNNTVNFDIINKIPIVINFKKAIIITKWQDKTEFHKKYIENIYELLFTDYPIYTPIM